MPFDIVSEHHLGPLTLRYIAPPGCRDRIGLLLFPTEKAPHLHSPRDHLDAFFVKNLPASWLPMRAWEVDSLVHLHIRGDPLPGAFSSGRTMRGSTSTTRLRFVSQTIDRNATGSTISTHLADDRGLEILHTVFHRPGDSALTISTKVTNRSELPLTLEFLSSFALGGITPFDEADASEKLRVHRFRSAWSAEGRHEDRSLEELQMERSWSGHGVRVERFGQAGSLPVNGFFPFLAIEDTTAGVVWAATLANPGSWQMDLFRRSDQLSISGGQADRELGHWSKTLHPGDEFSTCPAMVTAVADNLDGATDALLGSRRLIEQKDLPAVERGLPVVFNEWCTSWGNPTHENLVALADRLAGSGVTYLVIDDGWAERVGTGFQQNGDWRVNRLAFPDGLRATTAAIRERGLIPGIWFEFEVVNEGAQAWTEVAHQLHRDGVPLQVGSRRFWDFRDPWVHDYLATRVIALLRDNHFGYLKIDYNDTIGLGCDGAESLGEGLRQHLAGVQGFIARIRRELPELVIENCSSGGHRLEPSMMALTSMSSFSDAHESPDIPIIGANLHRLVLPEKCQIWCVLHQQDSLQRISYSLAATFLGRMGLSGAVDRLDQTQWDFVKRGIKLYREISPLLQAGKMRRQGCLGRSYQHPSGWQAVVCEAQDRLQVMVVWHAFADAPVEAEIDLPSDSPWQISRELGDIPAQPAVTGCRLKWRLGRAWSGGVFVLQA